MKIHIEWNQQLIWLLLTSTLKFKQWCRNKAKLIKEKLQDCIKNVLMTLTQLQGMFRRKKIKGQHLRKFIRAKLRLSWAQLSSAEVETELSLVTIGNINK